MKRQRGGNVNPPKVEDVAANAIMKKKSKKEVEQKVVKVEERIEGTREVEQGVVDNVMGWNWEEYMPWMGGVVDEQMSWGSTWFPWWDMDFNGEAFSSLYCDAVWDDDIWNLNKEIPITIDRKM
ncbi:hypothetical protein TanjilG_16888 [Lupinus angustifolius]|uniref:uncharacterized protein LOC109335184 n=1 Tax=Lupinus angustifolius TaxID=3871 RepID=UPI00090D14D4|nr:PREDICTED: uncharacterized protein LOC109335184 [Lupinus angustifolius]OIV90928.1 hypothetical protein TanjilG_16888 [Lupinus angustifolius]